MAKKKSRIDTRTVIIILIALAIIASGYVIFINLPPTVEYVTIAEVNSNKPNFVNTTQTVIGDFNVYNGYPVIEATSTVKDENDRLKLNYENIQNASDNLIQGEKYYFTGTLIWDEPDGPIPATQLILIADEFEAV
jgi:hypothetical protein